MRLSLLRMSWPQLSALGYTAGRRRVCEGEHGPTCFLCLQGKLETSNASVGASSQAAAGGEIDRAVQLSCGEHTDYGLLTLVNQDPDIPALQVLEIYQHNAYQKSAPAAGKTGICIS